MNSAFGTIVQTGVRSFLYISYYSSKDAAEAACHGFEISLGQDPGKYCGWFDGDPGAWQAGSIGVRDAEYILWWYFGRFYALTSCPDYLDISRGCVPYSKPKNTGGQHCVAGNPITISIGNKYQQEVDYSDPKGLLNFTRHYNSITGQWTSYLTASISPLPEAPNVIQVQRPDGEGYFFHQAVDGTWYSDPDITGQLTTEINQGNGKTYWLYIENDVEERYNADSKLSSISYLDGRSITFAYDEAGLLQSTTDSFGRNMGFAYDAENRIETFVDPSGNAFGYDYDATGRLTSITYHDNTTDDKFDNPKRIYHYEDSNYPKALTGITDENGNRYATWSYDEEGRAISSEHANGVDKTTLTYNADGTTTVTNSLGKQTTYHFTTIHGVKKVTQVEGHPTASCEGANKSYSYDANGNIASKTDWNGITTNYTYDMDRNLELTRTEAVGTPEERTITTEWHPQFRVPTKITEPGKITEYTYDTQGRKLSSKISNIQ